MAAKKKRTKQVVSPKKPSAPKRAAKPASRGAAAPKKKAPASKKKPASKKAPAPKAKAKKAATKSERALGETLLRAITMAIIADGEIAAAEEKLLNRFARAPLFRDLDGPKIVAATIKECIRIGPDAIFDDIASKLTTKAEREAAFVSCLAATTSDGKLSASEVRMLHALKDAFSIPTARAKTLAGPAAAIFR